MSDNDMNVMFNNVDNQYLNNPQGIIPVDGINPIAVPNIPNIPIPDQGVAAVMPDMAPPVQSLTNADVPQPASGFNIDDPDVQKMLAAMVAAIKVSNPTSDFQDPTKKARLLSTDRSRQFISNARKQTRTRLLEQPHTVLYIPSNSPLLAKNPANPAENKKLSKWTCSINMVQYTILANKQQRVPIPLWKAYNLKLLTKIRGLSGYEEYMRSKNIMPTDKFHQEHGIILTDCMGIPWETSQINPNSLHFNDAYKKQTINALLSASV